MAVAVGAVHVDVVPSTREFVKDMSRDLLKDADKLGKEIGREVGSNVAREVGKKVSDGIEKGVSDADTSGEAAKEGKKAGGAFARAAQAEITKALESLPEIDLNGDISGVMEDIALVRQALEDLRDKDIGVGVSGVDALTEIRDLQAHLDSLRNQELDVDVRFNIDQASKALTKLQKKIADDAAGSFDKGLRSGLESALKNLPTLQVDADTTPAQAKLAEIRADLQVFSDEANIDVNIDADAALTAVDEIVARLKALVDDETIDLKIRTDAAATIAQLSSVGASARELRDAFADVEDEVSQVERAIGGFAAFVRSTVASALSNLPDFEINTTPAEQALARVREELAAFDDLTIGVDLNARDAIAGIDGLIAELRLIEASDTTIDIKTNARDAIAELESVRAKAGLISKQVESDFERSLGGFGRQIQNELRAAAANLPTFEIRGDTSPILRQVSALKTELDSVAANILLNADSDQALRDIDKVLLKVYELDLADVDISIQTDVAKVIAQLEAARAKTMGLRDEFNAIPEAVGQAEAGMSRFRVIIGAVVALLPLIAAALIALPALIAAIGFPIAAVALGMDGIKAAASGLGAEFNTIKVAASSAFEQGLRPALQEVTQLIPTLRTGLAGTATALSEVAQHVADVATEVPNVSLLAGAFDQVNSVISSMAPALGTFIENILRLINIAGPALQGFGTQLQGMAIAFGEMITRLNETGAAQDALSALFSILGELIGLIAPLTELGTVLLASFGPAIASALGVIGIVITAIAVALDSLPGPLQTVAAVALTTWAALLIFGKASIAGGIAAIGTAFTGLGLSMISLRAALSGVATAFAASFSLGVVSAISSIAGGIRALGIAIKVAFIGNPLGFLIVAITTVLSLLPLFSSASDEAAAAQEAHKSAVEALSGALETSGGRITSQIVSLNETQLAAGETGDAFKTLGMSVTEAAVATAAGGVTYDDYLAKLHGIADQEARTVLGRKMLTNTQVAQIAAAKELIPVIEAQRAAMIEAGAANDLLAKRMTATGTSLVAGLGSAKAYEAALSTLSNEMSTASDKAKALDAALRSLDGGSLTAEEGAKKLNDAIRDFGGAFKDADAAVKGNAMALLDSQGAIDTTTEAGSKLFDQVSKLRTGMLEAASSAFEAGGGLTNLAGATAAAQVKVDLARQSFLDQAAAAGITGKAAQDLANDYLGFPGEIVTLLRAQGIPQTSAELLSLKNVMDQTPTTKEITVRALSAPAIAALDALNVKTTTLENGNVVVEATDKTRPIIDAIVAYVTNHKGNLPIGADGTILYSEIPGLQAAVEASGAKMPVSTTPAPAPQAGANEVRSDAQGKPAEMPVNTVPGPNAGAGVKSARDMAGQTPAEVPTNTVPGPGVLNGVDYAKGAAGSAVADVPTNTIAGPGINAGVEAAKAAAMAAVADVKVNTIAGNLAPGIDAAKAAASVAVADIKVNTIAGNLAPGIDAAKGAATAAVANVPVNTTAGPGVRTGIDAAIAAAAGATGTMKIDADPGLATGKLTTLVGNIGGTTGTMHIDSTVDKATGKLSSLVASITGTTASLKIDADPALADGKLRDLVARITGTTASVKIDGDPALFNAVMVGVLAPRTVTVTVNEVPGTQVGPNAMGHIRDASGAAFFARGGFNNAMSKAMSAASARIVPPNTFRVIGDRAHGNEAFIPINRSARSKSILGQTASQMGYGLVPMASGGLLSTQDAIRQALAVRRQTTQNSRSFLATGGASAAGTALGALTGGDPKKVEQKLDTIAGILAANPRGPASITVEDRSGNPVETARATQLALRLSR